LEEWGEEARVRIGGWLAGRQMIVVVVVGSGVGGDEQKAMQVLQERIE
jgi:hypothetical protein